VIWQAVPDRANRANVAGSPLVEHMFDQHIQ